MTESFNFNEYAYLWLRLVDWKDNTEAVVSTMVFALMWHKGECGPGSVIKNSQSITVSSMFWNYLEILF